jgi:hypothetical protein
MPLLTRTPIHCTLFHVVDTDYCMALRLCAVLKYERIVRKVHLWLVAGNAERCALGNPDTATVRPVEESK